jgi:hypothetical protein
MKSSKTVTVPDEVRAISSLPPLRPASEPPPALAPLPQSPRAPAEERSLALTMVRLLEGAGILSILVLAGLLFAEREQRRKLKASRPQASDGPEFATQLKEWKRKLPSNPRATIRFINAARFLYHVVGSCKPDEKGWENGFFTGLYAMWTDCPPAQPLAPDWLNREMNAWFLFAQPKGEPLPAPAPGEKRIAAPDGRA